MHNECLAAFSACFEACEWPRTETLEMRQDWTTREPIVESRVETLTREIVKVYWDAYYALRRSQADRVAVEKAWEETATRLVAVEASLSTQRSAWESKWATLIAQFEKAQNTSKEKESELRKMAEMMKTALENQMQTNVDLTAWTKEVHELWAQLKGTTPGTHPSTS